MPAWRIVRRAVVAGNEAPKLAVAHDGQRHGGADAHVVEVFDVDGGHAAEGDIAQVDRVRGGLDERHRCVSDIRDQALEVTAIEFASLDRDVGGREMQAEVGWQLAVGGFGDDFAAPVPGEPIDLDAVKAGQAVDLLGQTPADGRRVGGGPQPAGGEVVAVEHVAGGKVRVWAREVGFEQDPIGRAGDGGAPGGFRGGVQAQPHGGGDVVTGASVGIAKRSD
jgi:hypothetical protein